jgi:hypothetical protein
MRGVWFGTLRCLSADAGDRIGIVAELRDERRSQRQGRLIDSNVEAATERKKRKGYY